jgi:hypothetical protein
MQKTMKTIFNRAQIVKDEPCLLVSGSSKIWNKLKIYYLRGEKALKIVAFVDGGGCDFIVSIDDLMLLVPNTEVNDDRSIKDKS